jgi:hypothetical protein
MQSFIVQNFYRNIPFNTRTQRLLSVIKYETTQILWILLKINTLFLQKTSLSINSIYMNFTNLLLTFYVTPFIKLFKNIKSKKQGLYTNNFSQSLTYYTIKNLITQPLRNQIKLKSCYIRPVYLIHFAFTKTTYNTLIVHILFLLTHIYTNNTVNFKLWYNYILLPEHFQILMFCNNYYFKIRSY